MNRRGFLKFLSTATVAAALPAIGSAPALGIAIPGIYRDMRFDDPVSAPPGSRFENCWFSAAAALALPEGCSFFFNYFDGPFGIAGRGRLPSVRIDDCVGRGVVSDPSTADINGDWTLYMGPGNYP